VVLLHAEAAQARGRQAVEPGHAGRRPLERPTGTWRLIYADGELVGYVGRQVFYETSRKKKKKGDEVAEERRTVERPTGPCTSTRASRPWLSTRLTARAT
jgi:hypothetical protein